MFFIIATNGSFLITQNRDKLKRIMKWYVLVIYLVTGFSMAGLLVGFFNINPYQANNQVKYLFFALLFMLLWGFNTLAINKFKFKVDWPDFYRSFRTGLIIAVIIFMIYKLTLYII